MKPRRKNKEMNKITLCQGENSVCVKQQKQKEMKGLGPTAPKRMCRVALIPNPRRKRSKEQTANKKEGSFKRSLFKFAKMASKEAT